MGKVKHSRFDCTPGCSVEAAIGLIDGKWKSIALWHLLIDEVLRFGELRKKIPMVTANVLTRQLRELEEDGLIVRKVYAEVPPKVEYKLSELGKTLSPILESLNKWGEEHINLYGRIINDNSNNRIDKA